MKKLENGQYEKSRLMKQTNELLTVTGNTPEEAELKLKEEVSKYRDALAKGLHLVPTGEYVRSPGYSYYKDEDGKVTMAFNPDRTVPIMARPSLAALIQKEKANG